MQLQGASPTTYSSYRVSKTRYIVDTLAEYRGFLAAEQFLLLLLGDSAHELVILLCRAVLTLNPKPHVQDHSPDPWADPKCRSTSGFYNLHHRNIGVQNQGIDFSDSPGGSRRGLGDVQLWRLRRVAGSFEKGGAENGIADCCQARESYCKLRLQ